MINENQYQEGNGGIQKEKGKKTYQCRVCKVFYIDENKALSCCRDNKVEDFYECSICQGKYTDEYEAMLCCSSSPTEYFVMGSFDVVAYACPMCNRIGEKSKADYCCENEKLEAMGCDLE